MVRFPIAVVLIALLAAPGLTQPPVPFDDAGVHAVQFIDASRGLGRRRRRRRLALHRRRQDWERQKTGTRASLRGVHFQTPYTGWAVGRVETATGTSVGVMLNTTDGGLKWDEVGMNVLPGLHAVRFFDEKNRLRLRRRQPGVPVRHVHHHRRRPDVEAGAGAKLTSCRGADFFPGKRAGSGGGRVEPPRHAERRTAITAKRDLDPLAGRTVHGVCTTSTHRAGHADGFAAGDGGAVLTSTDGGKSWGFVNLGLPPAALAACDFRCVAAFGSHVWVAGQPGGFVLHSADRGKTWEVQKTELPVPVNGMHFLTHETGWMVGELGSILGTTDGGKTWKVQRAGGQRAAVLFLHASHRQRRSTSCRCSATATATSAPRSG